MGNHLVELDVVLLLMKPEISVVVDIISIEPRDSEEKNYIYDKIVPIEGVVCHILTLRELSYPFTNHSYQMVVQVQQSK